jgi:hypothetical protein
VTQDVLDGLRDRFRLREQHAATASAAIIDSASVKATETAGKDSRGYNAGNYGGRVVMPGRLAIMVPVLASVGGSRESAGIFRGFHGS